MRLWLLNTRYAGTTWGTLECTTTFKQMAAEDVILTKKIAHLRIHVEQAIGRVKEFRILQGVLPAAMWDSINQVIYVCCMLTDFNPPLVC